MSQLMHPSFLQSQQHHRLEQAERQRGPWHVGQAARDRRHEARQRRGSHGSPPGPHTLVDRLVRAPRRLVRLARDMA